MKIAICGAGIAGPTLAFWLQRAGHAVTLMEEAPHFRAGGYVIDFWGVGYEVAERMGLIDRVRARGYQAEEVRLVDASGAKAGGFPVSVFSRMTDGRYTSLPRGDLAEIIFDAVKDEVEVLFSDSVRHIHDTGNAVEATLDSGPTRRFDLLVGADGLHSRVRRILWGDESQFERPLGYYVAAFRAKGYGKRDDKVYVSYAEPGRSLSRFSMRQDETLFLFIFTADRMPGAQPQDPAGQKAALHAVFGASGWESADILALLERSGGELYFDRVSQIEVPQWSKGRTVLLGDAAACCSLLAGEGTGLAMTEAYVLAGELARSGGDVPSALAAYEARLRPFILSKQKTARGFASSFTPKTQFGIWLREMATDLMAFPPLADLFIGPTLKDDFDLPDYGRVS